MERVEEERKLSKGESELSFREREEGELNVEGRADNEGTEEEEEEKRIGLKSRAASIEELREDVVSSS